MKPRFNLTPQARSDLREILLDIAEDSPETAEPLRAGIYAAFARLRRTPGMGHFHEELLDRRYCFWNFYSLVVCYAWESKPIQTVAVVHGARELPLSSPPERPRIDRPCGSIAGGRCW